jgi:hypothetical protein
VLAAARQQTRVSVDDLPMLAIVTLAYALYRFTLCRYVLRTIGSILKVKDVMKFTHRSFDMLHYTISGALGFVALLQQPYGHCAVWAWNCGEFLGQHPDGFVCSVLEKVYYLLFTAYYVVDFFYTHTVREPIVYKIHHIVSVSMIVACVILKSPVVGPSIMLLHDAVDIPLYVGKILLYLGFKIPKDVSLVLFVFMCTWFRIINYPMIIWHCLQTAKHGPEFPVLYKFTCGLLCVLYGLHCVWEVKIARNVIGVLRGSGVHDDRSD